MVCAEDEASELVRDDDKREASSASFDRPGNNQPLVVVADKVVAEEGSILTR